MLAEGGPGQGAHRGALCLLRKDHDSQGPGATVFHSAPYGTWPLPSKGTCGVWQLSWVLKAPSAPWWKLPRQRLNFPLLFYKEQRLLLKSPNKTLCSQTQTGTLKCLLLLDFLSQFTHEGSWAQHRVLPKSSLPPKVTAKKEPNLSPLITEFKQVTWAEGEEITEQPGIHADANACMQLGYWAEMGLALRS